MNESYDILNFNYLTLDFVKMDCFVRMDSLRVFPILTDAFQSLNCLKIPHFQTLTSLSSHFSLFINSAKLKGDIIDLT